MALISQNYHDSPFSPFLSQQDNDEMRTIILSILGELQEQWTMLEIFQNLQVIYKELNMDTTGLYNLIDSELDLLKKLNIVNLDDDVLELTDLGKAHALNAITKLNKMIYLP